ncbi:Oxidative stress genes repressor [Megamonas hypermegale]|uniref:Oxidative stress genes repressor n=1 Tax=Megamonas hypermegale TaxID=158847 RepID=A0A239U5X5_9FIRM|nr:Fur family transcriptional regulator [Megamonas hypermegale]SNV05531.1 Oxidative stress genes repressor [Megamonas hypermegale]
MLDNKKVTELLRKKGFKVTPQRLAIYNVLCNTKSHPNAEMIFNKLQPYYPTMSLATIYKTVDILNEIGLINILNVGEDAFRYDANMTSHAHICCTECGRIDDIMMNFDNCVTDVENQSSYNIEKYQFYFYGVCAECKAKKEKVS